MFSKREHLYQEFKDLGLNVYFYMSRYIDDRNHIFENLVIAYCEYLMFYEIRISNYPISIQEFRAENLLTFVSNCDCDSFDRTLMNSTILLNEITQALKK